MLGKGKPEIPGLVQLFSVSCYTYLYIIRLYDHNFNFKQILTYVSDHKEPPIVF